MTSTKAIATECICALFLLVGCADKGEEEAEAKGAPLKSPLSEDDELADKGEADKATRAAEPDAGADAGAGAKAVAIAATPSEQDIEALVTQLKSREQAIALREREVIHREQLIASMEETVVKQTEKLTQLKSQATGMLAKLGKEYKEERKVYEEKLKKETEAREKERVAVQLAAMTQLAEREQRIAQLTAAIKGMRASSGAGMLASMEEGDAVSVLRQLGARQAAGLLDNMPANTAAHLAGLLLGPKVPSPEILKPAGKESALSGVETASQASDLPKQDGRQ